jgi:hypothetical protein
MVEYTTPQKNASNQTYQSKVPIAADIPPAATAVKTRTMFRMKASKNIMCCGSTLYKFMETQEIIKEIFGRYFAAQKAKDIKKLPGIYKELIISRNSLAKSKSYLNFLDLEKNFFRIPESDWHKYLSGRDVFATKYSPRLENSTNSPHFLSKIPAIDIEYPDGVFDFVAKKYPEINEIRNKITIEDSDKGAYYRYSKENNNYSIFIPQTVPNQKISMLLHEFAHVVSQEKHNHQIEGNYSDEFEAHKIEFDLAKDISEEFFQAVIGEYLMCLVRTEFQISIFENPEIDPISTYSTCFNKYIGKLSPENQTDFLFDKKITHLPLVDLPNAISIVTLLS